MTNQNIKLLFDGIFELDDAINSIDISGICADSRKVEPGDLFVALAGSATNGAKYSSQAIEKGALAILTDNASEITGSDIPVIEVEDAHLALARLAARFYERQPHYMAAVTGTAGKTSVTYFLRQIWEQSSILAASIGTTGVIAPGRNDYGNLTTPDPVSLHKLLRELAINGVTHGAMEASSHGLDQKRLHGVQLNVGAFTNLGRDHLDYHKNMESYFAAKMLLFTDLLPKGAPAVIFSDDPYSQEAIQCALNAQLDVKTVGRSGEFICLKRVEHLNNNQIVEIEYKQKIYRINFPFAGDFQVSNALIAAGMGIASGCTPSSVFESLENLTGAPGRLELVGRKRNNSPVYVDYAHKPEAMENVLTSLRPFATNKLVIVFGCGGDRDPGKRPIMGEIAKRLADCVIITDDNPRTEDAAHVRREIIAAVPDAMEIGDRKKAIEYAVDQLGTGDCLVVAGKGHETGQIVGSKVLEFSDHEVVRETLAYANKSVNS